MTFTKLFLLSGAALAVITLVFAATTKVPLFPFAMLGIGLFNGWLGLDAFSDGRKGSMYGYWFAAAFGFMAVLCVLLAGTSIATAQTPDPNIPADPQFENIIMDWDETNRCWTFGISIKPSPDPRWKIESIILRRMDGLGTDRCISLADELEHNNQCILWVAFTPDPIFIKGIAVEGPGCEGTEYVQSTTPNSLVAIPVGVEVPVFTAGVVSLGVVMALKGAGGG